MIYQQAPTRKSLAKAQGKYFGENKVKLKKLVGKLVKERAPWLKHDARHGGGDKHRKLSLVDEKLDLTDKKFGS